MFSFSVEYRVTGVVGGWVIRLNSRLTKDPVIEDGRELVRREQVLCLQVCREILVESVCVSLVSSL